MSGYLEPVGQRRRALPAVAVGVVLLLVVAACGGHTVPPSGRSSGTDAAATGTPSAVAYSACMRAHGVANFPDPDSNGNLPKADAHHLGVSSSLLGSAQRACQYLLPDGGGVINAASIQGCMEAGDCPSALVQQVLSEERRFAGCMRAHGVPRWPDPSIDSKGRPVFVISISALGFDPYSSRVWAKGNACSSLMPGLPGLPAQVSP
jgi:hypothetical protein